MRCTINMLTHILDDNTVIFGFYDMSQKLLQLNFQEWDTCN